MERLGASLASFLPRKERTEAVRIAQVSTVWESVPPPGYGGVERVVSYLTEELVRLGHQVTLYASGDSRTAARLVPVCEGAVRTHPEGFDATSLHAEAVRRVYADAGRYDVIHFHLDDVSLAAPPGCPAPTLTTFHNLITEENKPAIQQLLRDTAMVSISRSQRDGTPDEDWFAHAYHGLPDDLYTLKREHEGYLAFVGRLSVDKRPDRAVDVARRAGLPLKVAAKLDDPEDPFFQEEVEPRLDQSHVDFVGEVDDSSKQAFLGNARALIFPIDWPEPFGLVMIEAMACGTPVVAFRHGAVEEVIDAGITGWVCDDVEAAVDAVGRTAEMSREACRRQFERRFSATRMAERYVELYQSLQERPRDGDPPFVEPVQPR